MLVKAHYCIKGNVWIELLLLKHILKVQVFVRISSQRIKDKDVASVDINYEKNPVETVYKEAQKIRTK